jgi:hypothetical protein
MYAAFVVAYAAVASIQVEVGSGLALPTGNVLVPMLFELPPAHVPLVVGLGMLLQAVPDVVLGRLAPGRAVVLPGNALFALGPAAVMAVAGEPAADWHGGLVLVVAVAAGFALDFAGSAALEWGALGSHRASSSIRCS